MGKRESGRVVGALQCGSHHRIVVARVPLQGQDQAPESWRLLGIPEAWREVPTGDLEPVERYSWYRCLVAVPESWRQSKLTLVVEALDAKFGAPESAGALIGYGKRI